MSLSKDSATLTFATALKRLESVVEDLARTRGISITSGIAVDTPSFDGAPLRYQINLQSKRGEVVVYLDHDALMDAEECFTALTVPQLDAAVGRLRRAEKQLAARPS